MKTYQIAFGVLLILFALYGLQPAATPVATCPPPKPTPTKKTERTPEMEVISLVNRERSKRGMPTLKVNPKMMADAEKWSVVQARTRMHHSRMGYAENVAFGQPTPASVQYAWMTSRGHRNNILNPRYDEIGVGLAYRGNTPYWTQVFQ